MRTAFLLLLAIGVLIVLFGSPLVRERPVQAHYFDAPEPILPMAFNHYDHASVNCIDCHHNYSDDTGGGVCMLCHVTDPKLWPRFEEHFHGLCQGCHAERAAAGEDGGPPRACDGCHHGPAADGPG
ncbi:MAG: hypothetical protein EPO25_00255 [Gammaproteobacteria bacterium]|nr:MAG: hypothetical protein EPO25_00255 [Gammaproteobacteria bacterium]